MAIHRMMMMCAAALLVATLPHADQRRVVEIYLAMTKAKDTVENIVALLDDPEFQFGTSRGTP